MDQETRPVEEPRHSRLGVASFILSLLTGAVIFLLFAIAGFVSAMRPMAMRNDSPLAVFLGLLIIAALAAEFVAAGLGIAGLVEKNRKRVFAILGVILSIGAVILAIGLIVIGLLFG